MVPFKVTLFNLIGKQLNDFFQIIQLKTFTILSLMSRYYLSSESNARKSDPILYPADISRNST